MIKLLMVTIPFIFIAALIGAIYAVVSYYNPIIYLNILVIIGAVFALAAIASQAIRLAKSRNKIINILVGVFFAFVAIYLNWVTFIVMLFNIDFFDVLLSSPDQMLQAVNFVIENYQMTINKHAIAPWMLMIIYAVEAGIFVIMTPTFIKTPYFCEECENYYQEKTFYAELSPEIAQILDSVSAEKLSVFMQSDWKTDRNALLEKEQDSVSIVKVTYFECKHCHINSLVTIHEVTFAKEKKKLKQTAENEKVRGLYIDQNVNQFFSQLSHQ